MCSSLKQDRWSYDATHFAADVCAVTSLSLNIETFLENEAEIAEKAAIAHQMFDCPFY